MSELPLPSGYHPGGMNRGRLLKGAGRKIFFAAASITYLSVVLCVLSAAQSPAGGSRTVWDGVFTADQAALGRTLYGAHCAECHGGSLQGAEAAALSGERFWADWSEQTVSDLLTYVSRNMPFSEDGSLAGTLPPSTYAEIVAHILSTNGFPVGSQPLTAASAAGAAIVRKDGPRELPASTLAHVVGCLAPREADGTWRLIRATPPERVVTGTQPKRDVPLGDRQYALKFVLTPLTKFVGHRVAVTGLLLGEGGAEGLNVSTVESVADTCN